jgi:hypothetical protein
MQVTGSRRGGGGGERVGTVIGVETGREWVRVRVRKEGN